MYSALNICPDKMVSWAIKFELSPGFETVKKGLCRKLKNFDAPGGSGVAFAPAAWVSLQLR
jgi:hypothetical protein